MDQINGLINVDGEDVSVSLTWDTLKSFLPERVELVYVDYQDSLDNRIDEIQEAIHNQDWAPLDGVLDDWAWECESDSIDYLLSELKCDICDSLGIDIDQQWIVEDFIDENIDDLRDLLYSRDISTPLRDLMRHTSDVVAFYDTGFYIDSESWQWNKKELVSWREKVKRVLKVKGAKYNRVIDMMLCQASYGGRLVVYFLLDDIEKFINLGDYNSIKFDNPMIAVIDTFNGSGDNCDLPGHEFTLPLKVDHIILDKTIKYNYTYSVCGMYSNWCGCTGVSFLSTNKPGKIAASSVSNELSIEAEYKRVYESGSCTPGDMDIRRHRGVYYENNFPCGSHCPKCGTFWID